MKQLILICVLLSASFLYSPAQQAKIGVFIDPEISWLSPDSKNLLSNGSLMGVSGGLIIDKYFQKNYAFQTGIALGNYGGKLLYTDSAKLSTYDGEEIITIPDETSVTYRFNTISVPLNLKLKTNQMGYFSYFARLGFVNHFIIKAKASTNDKLLDNSSVKEEIFFYNLGYNFGIGLEYGLSEDTSLIFGINYTNGFIDIMNDARSRAFSRNISLRFGVIF